MPRRLISARCGATDSRMSGVKPSSGRLFLTVVARGIQTFTSSTHGVLRFLQLPDEVLDVI